MMNSGGFAVSAPQTGFSFATPISTAVVNPLSSMATGNALFAPQQSLGGGTTTNIFGVPSGGGAAPPAGNVGTSMFGTGLTSTQPSLFGGTNTTVSTGTTPSTGIFSGLTNPGIRPLVFPTSTTTTTNSMFGLGGGTGTPAFTGGGQMSFLGVNPTQMAYLSSTAVPPSSSSLAPQTSLTPIGLGGVDFSQSATGIAGPGGSNMGKSDSKTIKEQVLPNEISLSINAFRKYVKEQKVIREEISRVSSKPICKIQEETAALKQLLSTLSSGLQRNAFAIEKLKIASAQDLKNAEIAQRTKDLPPSSQFENTAPLLYFQELVFGFENQMQACRQQIEQLEQHFASLSQPFLLSPQELNVLVRRLHETFVALAAQLQTVHDTVRMQKESFLKLRRMVAGDDSNIFEKKNKFHQQSDHHSLSSLCRSVSVPVTLGPAPFSSFPSAAAMVMANALNRTQPSGLTGAGSFANPQNSFSTLGNCSTINPLGFSMSSNYSSPTTTFGGAVENKQFQLQKPPGNKRGKRWTTN